MGQLGSQALGVARALHRDVRYRVRVLQDPERTHEGRHPAEPEIELAGLDIPEMGALAYPDFLEQEAITLHAGVSPTHEVPLESETV